MHKHKKIVAEKKCVVTNHKVYVKNSNIKKMLQKKNVLSQITTKSLRQKFKHKKIVAEKKGFVISKMKKKLRAINKKGNSRITFMQFQVCI